MEELREEVPNGLTAQQLQNDVELRLRKAGIDVISANQANHAAAPYLYVRVNAIKLPNSVQYVYAVGIEFNQIVKIARDTRIIAVATTWDKGGTGCTSRPESIRTALRSTLTNSLPLICPSIQGRGDRTKSHWFS